MATSLAQRASGDVARAQSDSTPLSSIILQGERVYRIAVGPHANATVSADLFDEMERLGYSRRLHVFSNGQGRSYVAHSGTPSGRSHGGSRTLFRTFAALMMARAEEAGEGPAMAKGWIARPANGDPLDLTEENILIEAAAGRRNSWKAVADVKLRAKLVKEGRTPNRVFAERRRQEKAAAAVAAEAECLRRDVCESRRAATRTASPRAGGLAGLPMQEGQ